MLFELRTYLLLPGQATAYLDIFRKNGMHLITRHLPMLGYWMTESGQLNAIQHMWVYENFEERLAKRIKVAGDVEWNEGFVKKAFPLIIEQKSQFLELEFGSDLLKQCVASRNNIHGKQTDEDAMFSKNWYTLNKLNTVNNSVPEKQIGSWKLLSGDKRQSRISIERHENTESLFTKSPSNDDHQIMRPLSFSPLK